jgi:hypothetical protein
MIDAWIAISDTFGVKGQIMKKCELFHSENKTPNVY